MFSFLTVFAGGIALERIGWKIWLWMLLCNWVAMPFVWWLCPETTGKSLEEIDLIFAKPHVREALVEQSSNGSGYEKKREIDGSVQIERLV